MQIRFDSLENTKLGLKFKYLLKLEDTISKFLVLLITYQMSGNELLKANENHQKMCKEVHVAPER